MLIFELTAIAVIGYTQGALESDSQLRLGTYLRKAQFDSIIAKRNHMFLLLGVGEYWLLPLSVSDFPDKP